MKCNKGFTLLEIIASLIILGIIAVVIVPRKSDQGVSDIVDASVLKDAIRQTVMRSMSDLSGANWNINVASKVVQVKKGATIVSTYSLVSYSGSFSIAFDNFGRPPSVLPTLPYSITIESETGYVP